MITLFEGSTNYLTKAGGVDFFFIIQRAMFSFCLSISWHNRESKLLRRIQFQVYIYLKLLYVSEHGSIFVSSEW